MSQEEEVAMVAPAGAASTNNANTASSSNKNSNSNDSSNNNNSSNSTASDNLKEFESKTAENRKQSNSAEKKIARQSSAPNVKTRLSLNKEKNESKTSDNNTNNSNNSKVDSKINTNNNTKNNNKNNATISNNSSNASASSASSGGNSVSTVTTDSDSDNIGGSPDTANLLALQRATSMPAMAYDPCREFDNFAGDWVDSKGQPVIISAWGVIRYPNNPKLRFEAIHMGPNHLSVTFDRDPKKRKFVGKLNHDCNVLIWSNDTKWSRKGTSAAVISKATAPNMGQNSTSTDGNESDGSNGSNGSGRNTPNGVHRQGSCLVM